MKMSKEILVLHHHIHNNMIMNTTYYDYIRIKYQYEIWYKKHISRCGAIRNDAIEND